MWSYRCIGVAGDDLADDQVSIGRAAITAGADLVLGHGHMPSMHWR